MKKLFLSLPENLRGSHHEDVKDLSEAVYSHLRDNDTILIKGSNSMSMRIVVRKLIKKGNEIYDL